MRFSLMISTFAHAGDFKHSQKEHNMAINKAKFDRSEAWVWMILTLVAIAAMVASEMGLI
jgi:hypothetical protein